LRNWIIIGVVVAIVVFVGGIVLISINDGWQTAAYVSVVLLAMFQVFSTLLLTAILVALIYAIFAIKDLADKQVVPQVTATLEQVRSTATTARNTTSYVAEGVVAPIIKIASLATGVRAAAVSLARRNKNAGYEPE